MKNPSGMIKDRAFEKAVSKAFSTGKTHWVYQRACGRWFVAARLSLIPRGVFNYRLPCFEVQPVAEAVL